MFRTLLETKGYQVIEAADGEEAVEVTSRQNPGLVLLDRKGGLVVGIVQPLDAVGGRVGGSAINNHGEIREVADSRQKHHRVVRIANAVAARIGGTDAQYRQIGQLLQRDVVRHIAAFGFEQSGFGSYCDGLRCGPNLQREIYWQSLSCVHG